jgi:hypothetical protein
MNGLRGVFRIALENLRFGADDPRLALLSFAAIAAVIALIVVIVLLAQAVWKGRADRGPAGLPLGDSRGVIVTVVVVGSAVALAFGLGAAYLSRPDVCARCHQVQAEGAAGSTHAGVGCVSCHREPGPLGFVLGQIDYARWLVTAAQSGGVAASSLLTLQSAVANRACIRCHEAGIEGVIADDVIRVRHEDFLNRRCVECHGAVGHGDSVSTPASATMNTCLSCHDGRQVSSECSLCHMGDVALAAQRSSPRAGPIKVAAPTGTDCRGCHDVEGCNDCHGTEMPHPPDWMPGHARPAFEDPDVCWRCHPGGDSRTGGPHPYVMCNECHRFPGPHGSTQQWVASHGAAAAKAPGVFGRTRCSLCHTNERFCDLCHEGRREKVDYE